MSWGKSAVDWVPYTLPKYLYLENSPVEDKVDPFSPGARGVNPPPPWGVFEVKIFRKGIGYLNHCRFSPSFPGSVFGPRVEKILYIVKLAEKLKMSE